VNRDPIGYDGSQWNLYGYVGGMPTLFGDPLGLIDVGIGLPGGGIFPDLPPKKKPCPCWEQDEKLGASSCEKDSEKLCRMVWKGSAGRRIILWIFGNAAGGATRACDVPMSGGGNVGIGRGPAQPFKGALCECSFKCEQVCKSTGKCGEKGEVKVFQGGGCGSSLGRATYDAIGGWICKCPKPNKKCPGLCK